MARPCAAKIPELAISASYVLTAVLAVIVRAEVSAEHAGFVFDLCTRSHFNHFEYVELGCRVLFTFHYENILEALVVFSTVFCRTVTQAVKLETRQ